MNNKTFKKNLYFSKNNFVKTFEPQILITFFLALHFLHIIRIDVRYTINLIRSFIILIDNKYGRTVCELYIIIIFCGKNCFILIISKIVHEQYNSINKYF